MAFEKELQLARELGHAAGQLALAHLRRGIAAEDKPDGTPVTVADRECERLIVDAVQHAFPDDGLLGEEGSAKDAPNRRRWIVDPIDGTRDFLRGNHLWCNLIALEAAGTVELGVCTFPMLKESYWAVRGGGAWKMAGAGTTPIHGSAIADISRAVICASGLERIIALPNPEKLRSFLARFEVIRSLGGALDAMSVCAGQAEFWLEPAAKPWDLAVVQVIARESGLRFFDHTGADTIYGGDAILCVPSLEPAAREFLGLA
jgi:fructose-1,6-bisphosphatase/inositol monophosphatase family enzyme